MKQIDVEELKRLQVGILDAFDAFCRKNGIRYWLDFGTLLGAIRHKGFIPWDDDVDVSMLREDYEKAAALFNEETKGRYAFHTPSNDRTTRYPFGKVIDTTTVLYEYGESGIETGVYVDVFVFDNAPEDGEKVKRVIRKRDLLGRIRRLQLPMRKGIGSAKRVAYRIGSLALKPVPRGAINCALDRNARRYEATETKSVCLLVDPYDSTCGTCVEKSVFQDLIEVEFEGKMYPAPRQYDYRLRTLYGDYMELPPVEKRTHGHSFEAFYKE